MRNAERMQRAVTAIVAVMLAAACLSACLFPLLESRHDCSGEDCPVCMQIAVLRDAAKILLSACAACSLVFRSPDPGRTFPVRTRPQPARTPVSLKTKLSD